MNDIIEHYQLFTIVVIVLMVFAYLIYNVFFEIKEYDIQSLYKNLKPKKEEHFVKNIETHDTELLEDFQNLLSPTKGSIYFLKHYNLLQVYHEREWDDLYVFYEEWNHKKYFFIDRELEEIRQLLYTATKEFLLLLYGSSVETSNAYFRAETNHDRLYELIDEILQNYYRVLNVVEEKKTLF